jgi:Kef-type K+ transport system membrane component KefB
MTLIFGLIVGQIVGNSMDKDSYRTYEQVVQALTMWALSFIMIGVGYEFTVDKSALSDYAWDYLIAMTAAGFPWMFVATWFLFGIGGVSFDAALLIARFAAPTSAGILFSMLEGAGLKETWLFSKARILAIFDDLDTILLMIPLKIFMVGFKWELIVVVIMMASLLTLTWVLLHRVTLPHDWYWTLFYAAVVSTACKVLHVLTHHSEDMESIHIEVLLPAFVIGSIINTPAARQELKTQQRNIEMRRSRSLSLSSLELPVESQSIAPVSTTTENSFFDRQASDESTQEGSLCSSSDDMSTAPPQSVNFDDVLAKEIPVCIEIHGTEFSCVDEETPSDSGSVGTPTPVTETQTELSGAEEHVESHTEHLVNTTVSLVFMILVGLSMPLLVGPNAEDSGSDLTAWEIAGHILMVSILMILGKMFPIFCYRDEANLRERLALCLGMCPRGEVGASIIVISLELGVRGASVLVAMGALAVNLVLSGVFITAVKLLLRDPKQPKEAGSRDNKLWVGDAGGGADPVLAAAKFPLSQADPGESWIAAETRHGYVVGDSVDLSVVSVFRATDGDRGLGLLHNDKSISVAKAGSVAPTTPPTSRLLSSSPDLVPDADLRTLGAEFLAEVVGPSSGAGDHWADFSEGGSADSGQRTEFEREMSVSI